MRIGITGSSGFIGNWLANHLAAQGHQVVFFQRKQPVTLPPGAEYIPYDITQPETFPDTTGYHVLIHTAYLPFTNNHSSSEKNIAATTALQKACAASGTQFIFLSSMSAHARALSEYGKHKFTLEQQLKITSALVLKLGLVVGEKGLFSRIKKTISASRFVPLIGGGLQPVQLLFIDDLTHAVDLCIEKKTTGTYCLATPKVYTIKDIFRHIALQSGSRPVFVSIPYFIAEWPIAIVQFLRLPFPVTRENLLGLRQMKAHDSAPDLAALNITLKELNG